MNFKIRLSKIIISIILGFIIGLFILGIMTNKSGPTGIEAKYYFQFLFNPILIKSIWPFAPFLVIGAFIIGIVLAYAILSILQKKKFLESSETTR